MKKRILFAVLAMVLVLCGCSMKKAYKKADPPDMDITEDDTTGNPVKEPEIPGNKVDWTILMYVCGSDLESEDGFATDNFNEIKKIDFPDNINLVVEAGGTKKWHNGLDDNKLTRMVCKGNDWSVVGELKNASMGRTKTLSDFIKWGTKEYPADKYFLIIWNHGLIDFGGCWLAIGGYYCSAQLVNSNDDSNIYIIPVKYNGIETELCMVYSFDDDEYTIAGVYSYSQNEESSRLLDLKEGDEIIPIFMCSKITDGEDEETCTYEGGTIEYKEGINIEEVSLFDGEYLFRFDITDVFGEHYYSKLYLVEIEGEDIYTSLFE